MTVDEFDDEWDPIDARHCDEDGGGHFGWQTYMIRNLSIDALKFIIDDHSHNNQFGWTRGFIDETRTALDMLIVVDILLGEET